MYDKTKFSMLNIDDFFSSDQYQTIEDFSYADVQGILKGGYQIEFFYILDHVEVLSIQEVMDNTFLIDKANQILSYLGFDFKIGHPFELTDEFNHNYRFKDGSYNKDYMLYYYDFEGMLIVLGITWEGVLISFEMVNNKTIINNRLEFFNT
ncbi:hypothetical protein [Gilliamella apis]|uniref:Uncharacterized protein n=1 Tax=Gilliamella apis TaxID=1970738 RepID=A0A242NTB0_9GAMM|nr:hypothetical protein [Gilliamella apis]KES16742.1 hypothetical protein GASC598P17_014160 [Gilliamella apis SCGC AB-598-P17]OTQ35913.1 hypothetical protein B6C84_04325 [Gilliamella apis]OTQ37605.1 hypothetical protein B6C88_05640 [Gilliamella apis]OTQ41617.1 hypothetical protein B6D26_02620 [Gilliamella apis]OTQ43801.1 hypothetical protein B6C94_01715 [Gilliamella apis]